MASRYISFGVILLISFPNLFAVCPDNFAEIADKCYVLGSRTLNWLEAVSFCRGHNSILPALEDEEIYEQLVNNVVDLEDTFDVKVDYWVSSIVKSPSLGDLPIWTSTWRPVDYCCFCDEDAYDNLDPGEYCVVIKHTEDKDITNCWEIADCAKNANSGFNISVLCQTDHRTETKPCFECTCPQPPIG